MITRCLRCGNTIEGVAQLCPDCTEKERQESAVAQAPHGAQTSAIEGGTPHDSARASAAPQYSRLTATQFNLVVYAILGGVIAAIVAWLFAFGGAQTIGLRHVKQTPVAVLRNTGTPSPSPAPLGYEHTACAFDVPSGQDVDCGYLTVPQSRAQLNGPTIRLPVAVFKSASAERRPDPIVYLAGGPGEKVYEEMSKGLETLKRVSPDRDLIVFDQRGVGHSQPSLDCPELTQVNYDLLQKHFSVDQRVAQDVAATKQCHDRLERDGIDPGLATSAESAADVNDLRVALGYDQWNLYGVSYGTKLALTVMRDHPEGVRSVVLDSTYPLQVNSYVQGPADFDRALKVLFETCAADAACRGAYPDLENVFYETVRRLNETPVIVSLGTVTERPIEGAAIDGDSFAAFMFQSLYSAELLPVLPKAIFDTRNHDYAALTVLADVYLQNVKYFSPGMYLSVQCSEEVPFTSREALLAAAVAYPQLASLHEFEAKDISATCDAWGSKPAAGAENEGVKSDIPTLVLAGHFDPITPPDWGRLVAADLGNSFFFEFPGVGHGVDFADNCPLSMTLSFFDTPTVRPRSGCISGMADPDWVIR